MKKIQFYLLVAMLGIQNNLSCMEASLLPNNIQNPATVSIQHAPCYARYTLHVLYLSTLLTAIIGGYFLGRSVKTELELVKSNCHSMQDACHECTDAVTIISPYILALANFTQGCPNAMKELSIATYWSMSTCRDENKCKPVTMFQKP